MAESLGSSRAVERLSLGIDLALDGDHHMPRAAIVAVLVQVEALRGKKKRKEKEKKKDGHDDQGKEERRVGFSDNSIIKPFFPLLFLFQSSLSSSS